MDDTAVAFASLHIGSSIAPRPPPPLVWSHSTPQCKHVVIVGTLTGNVPTSVPDGFSEQAGMPGWTASVAGISVTVFNPPRMQASAKPTRIIMYGFSHGVSSAMAEARQIMDWVSLTASDLRVANMVTQYKCGVRAIRFREDNPRVNVKLKATNAKLRESIARIELLIGRDQDNISRLRERIASGTGRYRHRYPERIARLTESVCNNCDRIAEYRAQLERNIDRNKREVRAKLTHGQVIMFETTDTWMFAGQVSEDQVMADIAEAKQFVEQYSVSSSE